jgi:hypothetical protein
MKISISFIFATCSLWTGSTLMAGLTGAIFTTNSSGTVVNGNQYDSPCSVYLNGGPGLHAPVRAAGLPDGDYYFQVTDPSGKTLLSTDPVANRHFIVRGGIITAYVGDGINPIHLTGPDLYDPGGITIRLANLSCPADFLATPNNGGAYKVWVTPVADFVGSPVLVDNPCGNGCYHGFTPSSTKTDNFKVNTATGTFCLTVQKLFLQSDGVTLLPQANWEFDLTDPTGVLNPFFTDTTGQLVVCGLTPGSYMIAETSSASVYSVTVNNAAVSPSTSTSFSWSLGELGVGIVFINQTALPPLPM